eukprot:gene30846-35886_t
MGVMLCPEAPKVRNLFMATLVIPDPLLHSLPEHILAGVIRTNPETAEFWHNRFGHLSYSGLAQLVDSDQVKGIRTHARQLRKLAKQPCENM